jgi:hypothetical protein
MASFDGARAAGEAEPAPIVWKPRARYTYRLNVASLVRFSDGTTPIDFDVIGNLTLISLSATGDSVALYANVADATLANHAPERGALSEAMAQVRKAGCVIDLDHGLMVDLRVPPGLNAIAANMYRQIGASLQFARVSPRADVYSADEVDTTGHYVAQYQHEPSAPLWEKRKLRYSALLGETVLGAGFPLQVAPEILSSKTLVRVSSEGEAQSVTSRDEVAIRGPDSPVHGTTSVTLELASVEPYADAPSEAERMIAANVRVGADEVLGAQPTVESLDAARIQGLTFPKILNGLEAIAKVGVLSASVNSDADASPSTRATLGEKARLFEALAALYRQQPSTINAALDRVSAKSPASALLVAALGSASTEASQKALIRLIHARDEDPQIVMHASMALIRVPRPEPVAVTELESRLSTRPYDTTALYGLGTYCRRFRDAGKTADMQSVGDLLTRQLDAATTRPTRIHTLLAIANSGYAAALPKVAPFLADTEEDVRAAAVEALQSMRGPNVDELIAAKIREDTSATVRIRAMEAARVRQPSDALAGALVNAATSSDDAHVRYSAIDLMISWLPRWPAFRPTLAQVATNDGEARIRERASAAL